MIFERKSSILKEEVKERDEKISNLEKSFSSVQSDSLLYLAKKSQSYNGESKIKHFETFFKRLNTIFRSLSES